ncbi:hypothetical protein TNIN_183921 [Trichonephila inaurata madagascariensis]|uniref:Uncharacterized protein n=1 Tax=Trichonephila inaurata madagascariensis TaxID=2747483 RepID=A0A8X6XTN5_9ARAC|nr:hypothetical protein TNIN_183921 [Trichonephila inaurata madagascariensis]
MEDIPLVHSEREIAMTVKTTDNKELCDYKCLKRCLLLETVIQTRISEKIGHELEDMIKPANIEIGIVIHEIGSLLFYAKLKKTLIESAEIFGSSEIECAKFLLSRCIRLCNEPERTYLNFLLVAAFLKESVYYCVLKYKCYRMLYIGDFCFDVLYNRLFRKVFESRKVYEKLELFCKAFLEYFTPGTTQDEFQGSAFGKYWTDYVEKIFNVNNDSFSLTESEVEFFEKFYSIENYANHEEWPVLHETENTEYYFDAREHYPSDCETCGSKCFDYLNYVNTVKK